MAEEYLQGKDVLLYKYNTVDEEWEPVACATSNAFGKTTNFIESITKCDTATRRLPTFNTVTASVDLIISTVASNVTGKVYYNDLNDQQTAMTKAWFAFLSDEVTNKTIEHYFEAYIESIDITAEREGNVEASVSFGVDGDSTNIDPFATT